MNSKYSKLCRSTLAIAILLTVGLTSTMALAQDPEELVLKYGPDPEVVTRDSIELALQSWKWQATLIQTQVRMVRETGERGRQELALLNEQLSALQQDLGSVGLSFPLDVSSVQQIEAEIFSLESSLVGLQSRNVLLQEQSVLDRRQHELELQSKRGELELLMRELGIRRKELERVKQLVQNGSISTREVTAVESALVESEVKLKQVEGEVLLASELLDQSQVQIELQSVVEEQKLMQDRLVALEKKLERIRSTSAIHQYQALMFRMEMARKMMQMAQTRVLELELENTRNLALVELATKALRDVDEAGEPADDDED